MHGQNHIKTDTDVYERTKPEQKQTPDESLRQQSVYVYLYLDRQIKEVGCYVQY